MAGFDYEELLERCMGKEELLVRLVGKFREQLDKTVPEIRQAIQDADQDKVYHLAHSLSGAAANLAAHEIRTCSQRIEEAGRQGELNEAATQLEHLEPLIEVYKQQADTLTQQ